MELVDENGPKALGSLFFEAIGTMQLLSLLHLLVVKPVMKICLQPFGDFKCLKRKGILDPLLGHIRPFASEAYASPS
ncbi:hypothetical protein [uncultured Hoeflea sp.]|uniref:hypothetical protein n=1 Tax=uncultured Hoeflea sp. TaxID=538666 RepID=UPI0031F31837